jgi:hypothetical protein
MWNDTELPLAVFFTFRSYGTWLHGDERTSIDRYNNTYGAPRIPSNPKWKKHNINEILREPLILNSAQRRSVERAIRETCDKGDGN